MRGGGAAGALTPPGHRVFIHLVLTDEYPLALAQEITEAVATTGATEASRRSEFDQAMRFSSTLKPGGH